MKPSPRRFERVATVLEMVWNVSPWEFRARNESGDILLTDVDRVLERVEYDPSLLWAYQYIYEDEIQAEREARAKREQYYAIEAVAASTGAKPIEEAPAELREHLIEVLRRQGIIWHPDKT